MVGARGRRASAGADQASATDTPVGSRRGRRLGARDQRAGCAVRGAIPDHGSDEDALIMKPTDRKTRPESERPMDKSKGEMPFLDHLEELRWRIIWSLVAVVVGTGAGIWAVFQLDVIAMLTA